MSEILSLFDLGCEKHRFQSSQDAESGNRMSTRMPLPSLSSVPVSGVVNLHEILPDARFFHADGSGVNGGAAMSIRRCTTDPTEFSSDAALVLLPGTELPAGAMTDGVFSGRLRHDDSAKNTVSGNMSGGWSGAIIASEPIPGCRTPVLVVSDPAVAYGRICHALAGYPTRQLRLVGVLGSRSASGVATLLAGILQAAGRQFGMLGSTGCMDGTEMLSTRLHRRSVGGLVRWLQSCVQAGSTHAVLEITPSMLASGVTAGCEFDVLCVGDYVALRGETSSEMSGAGEAETTGEPETVGVLDRLFGQMRSGPGCGFAVFNADSPAAVRIFDRVATPALTVGVQHHADLHAKILVQSSSEQTFLMMAGDDAIPVRTRRIGHRIVSDSLIAAAVGLGWEVSLPTIVRGIESIDTAPGHCERIVCGQNFSVYVESRRGLPTLRETLSTLRDTSPHRMTCVVDAESFMAQPRRIQWIEMLAESADRIVLTAARSTVRRRFRSDDERARSGDALRPQLEAIRRAFPNPSQVQVMPDRKTAIAAALRKASGGDLVLLAGGRRTTDPQTGERIDDAEISRRLLRK